MCMCAGFLHQHDTLMFHSVLEYMHVVYVQSTFHAHMCTRRSLDTGGPRIPVDISTSVFWKSDIEA